MYSGESNIGVVLAERNDTVYQCSRGHEFAISFFVGAKTIPSRWACRCGALAETTALGAVEPTAPNATKLKDHRAQLHARRSGEAMETLLAQRLELHRPGAGVIQYACAREDCGRPINARGLCRSHYNSALKSGALQRKVAACWTDSGYRRHLDRGEEPCPSCKAAHAAASRQ